MSVLDDVLGQIDGETLNRLAGQLGATPQQTQTAIQMALPAIMGGMQRNIAQGGSQALHTAVATQHQGIDLGGLLGSVLGDGNSSGGLLGSVLGMIGGDGLPQPQPQAGGGLLGSVLGAIGGGPERQPGNPVLNNGIGILKHVFGNQQQRAVNGVARGSGLSGPGASALLALLAPMVMAALGKMMQKRDMSAQDLAGVVEQDVQRVGGGNATDRGFMGGLLDADGDGDVDASDLMNRGSMLMGLFGRR